MKNLKLASALSIAASTTLSFGLSFGLSLDGAFAIETGAMFESSKSAAPIIVSGSARFRFEDAQWYGSTGNPTSFTRTSFFSLRVRPKVEWTYEDGLKAVLTPQFAKVLGRDYSYTQTDSSGVIGYNEQLHMHEAYLLWELSPNWKISAGRMILSYGDQYIIAAGEWPLTGRAFDGAKFGYTDELIEFDILGLKLESTKDLVGSDRDLTGIYSKWKVLESLQAFDIYGFYESNQQSGLNESRHLYGIRMLANLEKTFDAGFEWATQRGSSGYIQDNGYQSMLVTSVGWTFADFYRLRMGLEYNQADSHWHDWYPLLKGPLGRNEVVGRRNLKAAAARVSIAPTENLKVRLDYWIYQRLDSQLPIYRPQDSIAVGSANGSNSDSVGDAIDLTFSWKVSDKVDYGVGATVFQSGDYLKQQFQDQNRVLTDFYAVTNITF